MILCERGGIFIVSCSKVSEELEHPVAFVSLYEQLFNKVWSALDQWLPLTWNNLYAYVVFCVEFVNWIDIQT